MDTVAYRGISSSGKMLEMDCVYILPIFINWLVENN